MSGLEVEQCWKKWVVQKLKKTPGGICDVLGLPE
jgi:hypothetical protein